MVNMAKKAKGYTTEQLIKKVKRARSLMSIFAPQMTGKSKKRIGTEMILETDEGGVRVLAYNLANTGCLPLFINIHGGGFVLGAAEMDDPHMMNVAENAGVKIISVDYSLAPEFPFPKGVEEYYAVVKYAKEHPDEFGIDPERIAVGGQSAGGNFTAAICLMENERKLLGIKCAILDYPPLDIYTDVDEKPRPKGSLPAFLSRIFDPSYLNDKESRKKPLVSPVFAETEQLMSFPPTLVITASRDSLCEEGERFKDMLMSAGIDVAHKRFDAKHGFNLKPGPESDESWRMIIDFLKRYI
jgi:acetyl esterase